MIKYKTDGEHDLRAYVNGTWVSLLGGGVATSNKYTADIVFVGGTCSNNYTWISRFNNW